MCYDWFTIKIIEIDKNRNKIILNFGYEVFSWLSWWLFLIPYCTVYEYVEKPSQSRKNLDEYPAESSAAYRDLQRSLRAQTPVNHRYFLRFQRCLLFHFRPVARHFNDISSAALSVLHVLVTEMDSSDRCYLCLPIEPGERSSLRPFRFGALVNAPITPRVADGESLSASWQIASLL